MMISKRYIILIVPIFYALFTYYSYVYSLERGGLPYTILPSLIGETMFFGTLLVGWLLTILLFRGRNKIILSIVYLILMSILLLALHFYIACKFGDCL